MPIATVISIIVGILFFGFLILIHEVGHFSAARAFKVRVTEFSIGMGPRLFSRQKGETLYSLKAIPFGGSVLMEEDEGESDDPRAFVNKKPWQRFIILFAGAFMNIVCGVVIMGIIVAMNPAPLSAEIEAFHEHGIMQEQGLEVGDRITHVNGRRVFSAVDVHFLYARGTENTMNLTVRRNGERIIFNDLQLARWTAQDGEDSFYHYDFFLQNYPGRSFGVFVRETFGQSASMARMIWLSLFDLITGQFSLQDMAGPVGLVAVVSEGAQQVQQGVAERNREAFMESMSFLLLLFSMISLNIGIMNLLPLPALDGGRIFFIAVEGIIRRPIPKKLEGWVHGIGFALLMALMLIITFSDIWGLVTGR